MLSNAPVTSGEQARLATLAELADAADEYAQVAQRRRLAVVAAAQAGYSWRQIAEHAGLSHEGARRIVVKHNTRHASL